MQGSQDFKLGGGGVKKIENVANGKKSLKSIKIGRRAKTLNTLMACIWVFVSKLPVSSLSALLWD